MIPEGNLIQNVERFSGFKEDYDRFRPQAPVLVTQLIKTYLGQRPSVVVDLGCGTGLSTFIWDGEADYVIGVEPNHDMRSKALEKLKDKALGRETDISFRAGYSNQLSMDPDSVDVVTCSQSFHWMEPGSTLREMGRILKTGGVFAAYDCDWPPTVGFAVEQRFQQLMQRAELLAAELTPESTRVQKWAKAQHLANMRDSQVFRFAKEIVFHNVEACNAERYIGLAMTQGGLQTVLKAGHTYLQDELGEFREAVQDHFQGQELAIMFSYRMRLGMK